MDKNLDFQIEEAMKFYLASGVEEQVDYQKFYLYSIVTHSTAIEGSTVTEVENQLLFDEGIAAKGRSLSEQMMNIDLKDAYLHAFKIASEPFLFTSELLQQLSAIVMRRTGSEYSMIAGKFDSSKGEFRLCNVSAGVGGKSYLAYYKVPQAVDEFCKWLNREISNIAPSDIAACYRLSFEAHFRLVTIHPWVDGNGRTSRLVMNMIQRRLGLVPSIVRKEDKGEYIQSLVDSRESEDSTLAQDVMLRHHIANLNLRALQFQQQDEGASEANVGENVGENCKNVGVNVGVKLTDTQKNVFELIKANPVITHPEIARTLSLSIKTIERATKALREYGLLEREGSAKSGSWVVLP